MSNGRKQAHERIAGSGYLSQDDPRVHFGLGTASKIDRLTITWPSGAVQVLENVAVDRDRHHYGAVDVHWKLLIPVLTLMTVFATAAGGPRLRFPSPIEVVVSPDGARVYILCEGTDEVAVYDTRRHAIVRRIAVGRVPKGLSLAAGGKRLVRRQLVERHRIGDRHGIADRRPHFARRRRAERGGIGPRRTFPLYRESHQQRYFRGGPRLRAGSEAFGCRPGRQLSRALAGRRVRLLHPHLPVAGDASGRLRNRKSRSSIRPGRWSSTASACIMRRVSFTSRFPTDGRLGIAAQLRPKNLIPARARGAWMGDGELAIRVRRGYRGSGAGLD